MTTNPFREMDRLFDEATRNVSSARMMPMDLTREGDKFVVKMDLPGVDPNSIDIDVDDRTLTIRAERKQQELDTNAENHKWLSRERTYGSFARQLTLGNGLNLAEINADYTDGVLTITIPVADEAKPRKIQVNTSGNTQSISTGESQN